MVTKNRQGRRLRRWLTICLNSQHWVPLTHFKLGIAAVSIKRVISSYIQDRNTFLIHKQVRKLCQVMSRHHVQIMCLFLECFNVLVQQSTKFVLENIKLSQLTYNDLTD